MSPFICIQIFRLSVVAILVTLMPSINNCEEMHFNRNVTGIVFSPYIHTISSSILDPTQDPFDNKLVYVKRLLKVISSRFSKVFVLGSDISKGLDDKYTPNQTYNNNYGEIYAAKAAALLNKEANKHILEIALGITISENPVHTNNAVQLALDSVEIANNIYSSTVTGIVLSYQNGKHNFILSTVLDDLKAVQDIRLGSKQNCEDLEEIANGLEENTEQDIIRKDIILNSDFIICEILQNSTIYDPEKVKERLNYYHELLQAINPGIQTIGLTGYPTYQNSDFERMKFYWEEMDRFAVTNQNNITILMKQAFDQTLKQDDGKYGWWKLTSYKKRSNKNVYIEKISEIDTQTNYKPSNQTQASNLTSQWAYFWLCGGVFLLALILLLIYWVDQLLIKFHDRKNVLTTKEVQNFRQGVPIYTDEFTEEQDAIPYYKLPYSQQFEIDKKNLWRIEWGSPIKTSEFYSAQIAKLKVEDSDNVKRNLTVSLKTTRPNCPKHLLKNILREIKLLTYLGVDDHIVTLIGAHTAEIHNGVVYMVTELCSLGSLKDYLKDNCNVPVENVDVFWGKSKKDGHDCVTFEDMLRWSHEIACAMDYLGSKNIIHGDLAARNVHLTSEKTAKISGFEMSRSMKCYKDFNETFGVKTEQDVAMEDLQDRRWMALEAVKREIFSTQSDVWSYGVTLWEIFSFGEMPYNGPDWLPNYLQKLGQGIRLERPYLANTDMYNLMFVCWANKPKNRPKFTNLKFVTALLLEIFRTKSNHTHVPTTLIKLISESETDSESEYEEYY